MAAAQRGQIVQRVLVDGWSAQRAAGAFGIDERVVTRWVAAYRRYGMASLKADDGAPDRFWRQLASFFRRLVPQSFGPVNLLIGRSQPAPCVVLRRRRDDLFGQPGPATPGSRRRFER